MYSSVNFCAHLLIILTICLNVTLSDQIGSKSDNLPEIAVTLQNVLTLRDEIRKFRQESRDSTRENPLICKDADAGHLNVYAFEVSMYNCFGMMNLHMVSIIVFFVSLFALSLSPLS